MYVILQQNKTKQQLMYVILQQKANQGDPIAQCLLGECYEFGDGVDPNHQEAVRWYIASSEQGNVEALINLGHCYEHGLGVLQDDNRAKAMFEKALYMQAAQNGYKVVNGATFMKWSRK